MSLYYMYMLVYIYIHIHTSIVITHQQQEHDFTNQHRQCGCDSNQVPRFTCNIGHFLIYVVW